MELVTNTDSAIEFINGVIPSGMAEEAAKVASVDLKVVEEEVTVLPKPVEPDESVEPTILTKADLVSMPQEELDKLAERIASGEVKMEV